jgi:hypothetical protein
MLLMQLHFGTQQSHYFQFTFLTKVNQKLDSAPYQMATLLRFGAMIASRHRIEFCIHETKI